jgi:hypothetical protein
MSVISVLIVGPDNTVLLGKHADGPFKGKWGIPSLRSEHERRPQICAAQLVECSLLGIVGKASSIVKECKPLGKTANGMIVYVYKTNLGTLDSILTNSSAYLKRCFPVDGLPKGIVAWDKCLWNNTQSFLNSKLDTFTQDALQFFELSLSR